MAITPGSIDAGVGIGEIFVEKYRVEAILGHGGMGVVAMCTHLALNERVAIKMLRKDVLDDADAVERFMREAQAAVKLKSEYVARVTDVGRSSTNVPYMVMEYLEGHDLGQLLDERRTIGVPWAVEITMQCCEALAEAHSLGIVHRDVKPTNLFVTWRPDGSALIKVLDFGISKALTGNAMALTQTQSLLGTPAYMSPEQMRSARMVDARTDIWSLGTVLYEMLEGRRPFEAESFSEMCVKVAVDPPDNMTNTPLALQQVVLRCLEKAPEQRYQSMAELAHDLVPFSQDSHQAQVLVERMARTLRRSQVQPVEWNPASSGLSNPMRQPSAERAAAASAAAAAAAVTAAGDAAADAAATPGAASSASPPPEAKRLTGSKPAFSETMDVIRPRRRGAIAIATAVVVAAAIGVTISLLRTPEPVTRPAADVRDAPPAGPSTPPPAKVAEPGAPPGAPQLSSPPASVAPTGGPTGVALDSPYRAAGSPTGPVPVAAGDPAGNNPTGGTARASGQTGGTNDPTRSNTPSPPGRPARTVQGLGPNVPGKTCRLDLWGYPQGKEYERMKKLPPCSPGTKN